MVNDITNIPRGVAIDRYQQTDKSSAASGFKETLNQLTNALNTTNSQAVGATRDMVMGHQVDSHDVMLAAQEAGLAFDLMLEVRNKLLEAYQEIMRMQV